MLTYDDQGRACWNGERVPRTTEVCALLAPRWLAGEYYLRKGTLIHRIAEWEDTGELDESSVDPALVGYLEAYRKFKAATGWRTLASEQKFFHEKYLYCGRADRVGVFDTKKWVWTIDLKSGQPHEADKLQAPAYLFGLKSQGYDTQKCADLYLKANGSYRFVEVKNPTAKFLQFLTGIQKWREQNGNGN